MAAADKTKNDATTTGVAPSIKEHVAALRAKFEDPNYWLEDVVDEDTGEVTQKARYRYLEGKPMGIRADMKNGQFNIEGVTPLGKSLSFQPIAWRIFNGVILNDKKGPKDWAELFFFNDKKQLCAVLFHGYSVTNLRKLEGELFYSDRKLSDVVITATFDKKQQKGGDQATYYIASFEQKAAENKDLTREYAYFAKQAKIYRKETAEEELDYVVAENYYNPYNHD